MDRAILSSLKLGVDFSSLTFSPHNDSFESLCGVFCFILDTINPDYYIGGNTT